MKSIYKFKRKCKLLKEGLINLQKMSNQDKDFPYLDTVLALCKKLDFPERKIADIINEELIKIFDDISHFNDSELKKIIDSKEGDL